MVCRKVRAMAAAGVSGGASFDRLRARDRKSTRLNSSHTVISYAVFCLKKKKKTKKDNNKNKNIRQKYDVIKRNKKMQKIEQRQIARQLRQHTNTNETY